LKYLPLKLKIFVIYTYELQRIHRSQYSGYITLLLKQDYFDPRRFF